MKLKRVALIGLGPHAKRIYFPYLNQRFQNSQDFKLSLVVDLQSKKDDIATYLKEFELQPTELLLIDDAGQINPKKCHKDVVKSLKEHGITHVIISTEPKSHKVYLRECIKNGLSILVDKPVTSPVSLMSTDKEIAAKSVSEVTEDVIELIKLTNKYPKSRVIVQSQRRCHDGYRVVFDQLNEIVSKYKVPITFIGISHSDGMWNMPSEYFTRENHPYKYGYGKLMHSGYHFVDLLCRLQAINQQLKDKKADTLTVFNQLVKPKDQMEVFNSENFRNLLSEDALSNIDPNTTEEFGELDSYSQFQFLKGNRVITTAQMSLIQSGFSKRAWTALPVDTYKGNGRIRHESINVHVGPLFNIQVHSYQDSEVHEEKSSKLTIGGRDHFDIYIFKNSNLLGGNSFEHIELGKQHYIKNKSNPNYLGHNEHARQKCVDDLLDNKTSSSELPTHLNTAAFMAILLSNQCKLQQNQIPYSSYNINELAKGRFKHAQ